MNSPIHESRLSLACDIFALVLLAAAMLFDVVFLVTVSIYALKS